MNEQPSVVFQRLETASGHAFGRATLNAPGALNALSMNMIDRLEPQLREWAHDDRIAGVILDAAGDKAFCAGGDVVALYRSIRETPPGQIPLEAAAFFEREYRLDYRLHTFPKPVLCWGHGIVMGGGVGLLAGASHRVATPKTRLAMPEISLGLYPDVGGSWFLPRMPGRLGLFLALTGAPLNASDACFAGLADFVLAPDALQPVLEAVADETWQGERETDSARLSHVLERFACPDAPPSEADRMLSRIDAVIGHDGLPDAFGRLRKLRDDAEPWLAQAAASLEKGSPTSAVLSWTMQRRLRHASLADVFRQEYQASVGCCMHPDFPEGVRALLIDKDKQPRWAPDAIERVSQAFIDAHLQPRFAGPHPLSDL